MPLYHFSEEPHIRIFEPRRSRISSEAHVWAIDEWHAPMYYFPRDCPRACFWPGSQTSAEDRERWFGGIERVDGHRRRGGVARLHPLGEAPSVRLSGRHVWAA